MEKAGRRPRYRGKNPRSFSEKYNIEPPHNDNIDVASV
jgi:16S rRNA (cytosine1402-N4)-methyltransferase